MFRAVASELGEPGLDLFATCLYNQLPVYVSLCLDNQALALDALSLDLNTLPLAYAFPPMPILPKVLQKIRDSTVTVTVMANTALVPRPAESPHPSTSGHSGTRGLSSHNRWATKCGLIATWRCTTTIPGCCQGFSRSQRVFCGSSPENIHPSEGFNQNRVRRKVGRVLSLV